MSYSDAIKQMKGQELSRLDATRLRALLIFDQLGLPFPSEQYEGEPMGFIFDTESGSVRIEIWPFPNGDVSFFGNWCPSSISGDAVIERIADEFTELWGGDGIQ